MESTDEEKQKAHLQKTRKGLIEFMAGMGGIVNIAELHEYSESTYFVGHKKFSDLMEEMIEDGALEHNDETRDFILTDSGRSEL